MAGGSNDTFIFIVGNPRSGTTMMSRIMGNHPSIHSFKELHFFEKQWSPEDEGKNLSFPEAAGLAARLVSIQKSGFFVHENPSKFIKEGEDIVEGLKENGATPIAVYATFLKHETFKNGKTIPCEQTHWYVYYIDEILTFFPEARIINLVRDPRDVLLSQKKRWLIQYRSKMKRYLYLTLRTWMNYHPISTSRLWRSAVRTASRFEDKRVHTVKFEDILEDPEREIRKVADFVGVPYHEGMLDVPKVGSSIFADKHDDRGIDRKRTANWQKGLNKSEIYISQKITAAEMDSFGYRSINVTPNPIGLILYLGTFGIKLLFSRFMHKKHIKNLKDAVRRRMK